MKNFRLALTFLTLLPIAPKGKIQDEDWSKALKYFSLIGLVFGLFNLMAFFLLNLILSITHLDFVAANFLTGYGFSSSALFFSNYQGYKWLFALVIFCTHIFLSGGLHLDGLMDCFDGIAASKATKEETIKVMQDSRVGAFAVMAAFILMSAKLIALAHLRFETLIPVLILVPMLSRMMAVAAMSFQKTQGGENRTSTMFEKNIKIPQYFLLNLSCFLAVVFLICYGAPVLALFGFQAFSFIKLIFALIASVLVGYVAFAWLAKKLYGHCGDTYGAGIEITEAFAYFVFALI